MMSRVLVLVVLATTAFAGSVATAATAGGLRQLPLASGCREEIDISACAPGEPLGGATKVAVSPNGKHVYVAASGSNAVTIFDRDVTTGALSARAGTARCISQSGGNSCTPATAFSVPTAMAFHPSGSHLYVATADGIAVLAVSASGALSQAPGATGCMTPSGAGGCSVASTVGGVRGLAVSPDGKTLYTASETSDGIAILDIASDGSLSQTNDGTGCIDEDGGNCIDGVGLDAPTAVAAPTNGLVVVGSSGSDAVTSYVRSTSGDLTPAGCIGAVTEPACTFNDGLLDTVAVTGTASRVYAASAALDRLVTLAVGGGGALSIVGCVANGGAAGCASGRLLDSPAALALSPDQKQLYVASSDSDSLTVFDTAGGALAQRTGTENCVANGTLAGNGCASGAGLDLPRGVAVAPGGATVYTAAYVSRAVAGFDRDTATPVCQARSATARKNWRVSISLRCSDGDRDTVTYRIVQAPSSGSTRDLNTATGSVVYVPDAGFYGTDSFTYAATALGVSSSAAKVTVRVVACPGFEERAGVHLVGTAGENRLTGTSGRDVICGRGGPDHIEGRGGDDLLLGGAGADEILGQRGADRINGQRGRDDCLGGPGKDVLRSCETR